MKDQIKKALTDKQFPDAIADRVVAILRDKCCMGADPTAGMLAHVTKDDMVAAGIAPAAAGVIETLLRAPKGPKKYKSGRSYSAAEYAEHYERDPENAALVADITRATTVDGKPRPWVIAPGKFRPEQSAQYIAWHMAEDPAPAVIMVDGQPVAPVMPGEERKKDERLYYVDPFTPDALEGFLDVEMASPRTRASFKGYSDEALSAMQSLWRRELRNEGSLALRRLADEMRGKGPAEILGGETLAAWNANPKRRPDPKRAKVRVDPFVEPTPVAAPSVGAASTAKFDVHAAHAAIIQASAAGNRDHFLGGLPAGMVASLPRASTPATQVLSDLATLAQMSLADGTRPEQVYIENAIHLIAPRREADVLRAMLAPREPATR